MGVLIKDKNKKNNSNHAKIKRLLKDNTNNISVELVNLTSGSVVFKDQYSKERYLWNDSGDSKTISLSTFNAIYSDSKSLLTNMYLGISQIYVEEGIELSMKDFINSYELGDFYKTFRYDITNIDGLIIDKNIDSFKKMLESAEKSVVNLICERYQLLKREGYISDYSKENALTEMTGKDYLFNRI